MKAIVVKQILEELGIGSAQTAVSAFARIAWTEWIPVAAWAVVMVLLFSLGLYLVRKKEDRENLEFIGYVLIISDIFAFFVECCLVCRAVQATVSPEAYAIKELFKLIFKAH